MSQAIAEERIERLADLSKAAVRAGEDDRAREYVRLARRVAERHRLGLPGDLKRYSCDRCDARLVPGRNARVRVHDGRVRVTCECGEIARFPYD